MGEKYWESKKCKAHNRQGNQCGRWAIPGLEVCDRHGGKTPVAQAAAKRRLAQMEAITFGAPMDIGPHQALMMLIHGAAGAVAWLRFQVEQVEREAVVWGKIEEIKREGGGPSSPGDETKFGAATNMWVKLLGEWSDRLAKYSKTAIDAGVSEALVRIEERKGQLLADVIQAVIEDPTAGLTDEQRQRQREIASAKLREIAAAA